MKQPAFNRRNWILLLAVMLLLAACGADENAGAPEEAATEDAPSSATVVPDENPAPADTESGPDDTAVTEEAGAPARATSSTSETGPPTATPLPTTAPYPTATAAPVTPTPDAPAAPHMDVEQAPYAESDCSDKYPCNDDVAGWLGRIRVPPGFEVDYFARVDDLPTSLAFGPDGDLYVAGRLGGIYRVDQEGQVSEFYSGLNAPTGIAFQPGTERLFVSNRVTDANVDGEGQISVIEDGQARTLIDGLPCCYVGMHGPNGIAFGPDGYGYIGVGGRADHGEILVEQGQGQQDERHPQEAAILRFAPDGSLVETYARGFRNPYDIAWDARGELYATDNARDGNRDAGDNPPDELHRITPGGEHGYPWYDCPNCFSAPDGVEVIPPLFDLLPHGAAAGITAYHHEQFPGYYDDLFLVQWSAFEGAQNVLRVDAERSEMSVFATGFAQPIDIVMGPDGNLYVTDYATGIIFRIRYGG